MRILHLELGRHLYGGAKQVVYLINAIQQSDNDVRQLLACAEDSEISTLNLSGCDTHALSYAGEADVSILWRLAGLIRAHKPDILHVHSRRGADIWGALLAKRFYLPAVCTRRVDNTEAKLNKYKYQQYSAVVSISRGVHDVVSVHCSPEQPQPIIHSAVDFDEFPHTKDNNWFKTAFDIPDSHTVIANFAQLIPRKGQADLIAAMSEVIRQYPETTCLLFGKGKMAQRYQQLIDQSGLQKHVRLCGFTKEVPRILPNIDLMVHPAHAEGLGVILLQAGACRVPVIACPSGGIPEIIQNRKTGILVPAGAPELLAKSITSLLKSPTLSCQYGEALYHHVESNFSTTSMANAYLNLYQQLV